MKLKSFFIAILSTFVLLTCASSYALDVYLKNSSVHNVLYFKFPNGRSYGPVPAGQEVRLPWQETMDLSHWVGEVYYTSNTGVRSCGFVDFTNAQAVAFRVNIFKTCSAVVM